MAIPPLRGLNSHVPLAPVSPPGTRLAYVEELFRKTGKIIFAKGRRPLPVTHIERYIHRQRKKKIRDSGFTGGRVI